MLTGLQFTAYVFVRSCREKLPLQSLFMLTTPFKKVNDFVPPPHYLWKTLSGCGHCVKIDKYEQLSLISENQIHQSRSCMHPLQWQEIPQHVFFYGTRVRLHTSKASSLLLFNMLSEPRQRYSLVTVVRSEMRPTYLKGNLVFRQIQLHPWTACGYCQHCI